MNRIAVAKELTAVAELLMADDHSIDTSEEQVISNLKKLEDQIRNSRKLMVQWKKKFNAASPERQKKHSTDLPYLIRLLEVMNNGFQNGIDTFKKMDQQPW